MSGVDILLFTHLQWLEEDFLGYLKKWEESVAQRPKLSKTKGEKSKMLLSSATRKGLNLTGILRHIIFSPLSLSHTQLHTLYLLIISFTAPYFCAVKSFIELTKILLPVPGVQYVLSEKFCQDPVESFFGKQRAQGGRNDNPNAKQFMDNTTSLRVQGSMALEPVRGNCSKRRNDPSADIVDDSPLPKRIRARGFK